jgi:Flp pilus assembly secretin CpaC
VCGRGHGLSSSFTNPDLVSSLSISRLVPGNPVTRSNFAVASTVFGALAAVALPGSMTPAKADVQVVLDQAKILRLPAKVSTIIIGNPAIADVTIQRSGIAIVTGKTYGTTNMIVLGAGGEMISEEQVVVKPPEAAIVTVQRGMDRESLACTPTCEKAVKVGDAAANFDFITGQATAHSAFSTSQTKAGGQ